MYMYSKFNHKLNSKAIGTKHGLKNHSNITFKTNIIKQHKTLQNSFFKFNFLTVPKYVFLFKEKDITMYLNKFLRKKYKKHFSDIFYDFIIYKTDTFNISFKKKQDNHNTNSQMQLLSQIKLWNI